MTVICAGDCGCTPEVKLTKLPVKSGVKGDLLPSSMAEALKIEVRGKGVRGGDLPPGGELPTDLVEVDGCLGFRT